MNANFSIPTPPWGQLEKRLESMCRKALFTFNLLDQTEKVAVALSGGKDSLSLLFLLHLISGKGIQKFSIYAIHVTGEFSCGAGVNLSFLQKACDALEVPLIVKQSHQKLETLECYSCSRERRSLIFRAAKELGINHIAFGHHRDDSVQTLLMNLLHKAEFAANLPKVYMHDFEVTIIRPLIYIVEEDLKRFAEKWGFARITCGCPVGQNSLRKKAETLLSQIEKIFPNARENLASAGFTYGSDKALRK